MQLGELFSKTLKGHTACSAFLAPGGADCQGRNGLLELDLLESA